MKAFTKNTHVSHVVNSIDNSELIASRTLLHPDGFNGCVHYHDNAHFSFVLRGGCAEKKAAHYERLPGSITWYPSGEQHQITKVTAASYHVNFELLPAFFSVNGIKETDIGNAVATNPSTRSLMLEVYNELDKPGEDAILSLHQILLSLAQQAKALHKKDIPRWVKIVQQYLHDNWNQKITLHELSQVAGVHPVTISKYFHHYFSCTLGQYRRKIKIDHAIKKIAQNPQINFAQLSFDCGFADESHLIRCFKQFNRFPPGAYRNYFRKR